MKVEVTKSFAWAPDGNSVRTIEAGQMLEGRGAEVALELGCGRELQERATPAPSPMAEPPPVEPEKSTEPPEAKVATAAPRRKGR